MEFVEETKPKTDKILGKILLSVSSFPSMPKAGVKLMTLLEEKDVSLDKIEKILNRDPGLTVNVLKLANSSYFGIPSKIGSAKHAIALLGTRRFSQIVLTACMNKSMDQAVEGYELPSGDLWHHSIVTSKTAEALAKFIKLDDAVDVFTPALLHDMGKVVLGSFISEEIQAIEEVVRGGLPMVLAENMILGTDHAEIGSQILANWFFPADIVNAVRLHHNPERVKNSNLQTEIVHLSDILSHSIKDNDPRGAQFQAPSPIVLKRLGMSLEQYELIRDKVALWMNESSGSLQFE